MKELYNTLALNPDKLKEKISEAENMRGKCWYAFLLVLRAVLVVVFSVIFITILNTIFGEENSSMATVIFVLILTFRFMGFGYCIGDTLINLAVLLAIMVFMPSLALMVPPVVAFLIHFLSLFVIILITCQNPRMGLGGFFGFAYSYLTGYAVQGSVMMNRAGVALVGFVLCALILIHKHRKDNSSVRFYQLLKNFSFKNIVSLWQIRLALGVSIILTFGSVLGINRFMWMAFACSTVLARYPCSAHNQPRFRDRIEGIAIGSTGFYVLMQIVPESMLSVVSLVAGGAMALCANYRWQTILICFGALSLAAQTYGVQDATLMRIVNNVIGAVFGMAFALLYDKVVVSHLAPQKES